MFYCLKLSYIYIVNNFFFIYFYFSYSLLTGFNFFFHMYVHSWKIYCKHVINVYGWDRLLHTQIPLVTAYGDYMAIDYQSFNEAVEGEMTD